jgi:signal transduction histidine kinase/HAMP domain-containing protein
MSWLSQSLNRKFAAGTAAGLLVSSLFFLVLFVNLYRGQLEHERTGAAGQWSRLVQTAFAEMVAQHDAAGLTTMVTAFADEPGVLTVKLADATREVRFASDVEDLGTRLAATEAESLGTRLVTDADGREVLRSVSPIGERPCPGCADSETTSPINGLLFVDFDAGPISDKARATTLLLMGSGALIVLINIAGGWWFIRRYVIRPVEHLSDVSLRLTQGDLDARLALPGGDEFSALAGRFNTMAQGLQDKIRQLEDKEVFLQALVDAIPDGIRVIDEDYQVALSNATYRDQHGYRTSEEVPRQCYAATHDRTTPCPETLTLCTLKEVTRTGEPVRVVHRHTRADSGPLEVEIYAAPLHTRLGGRPRRMIVESIRDLEQQVRFSHEQRLSELGRLAAGVAHEIHNPLAAVRMALHASEQIAAAAEPDPAMLAEYLELVDHEVVKCIEVTERLLKLSIPPSSQQELVVLERVVEDTLKLLGWEAQNKAIQVRFSVDGPPLRVLATDSDLRMMTLNLAQNACHAMPRGGSLVVRCWRDGDRVAVLFEDSGVGIEPADLPRIFDPFFSRRADGVNGTGLGLSITKNIVEGHGGTIRVESAPGAGTRFVVSLPDADVPPAEEIT